MLSGNAKLGITAVTLEIAAIALLFVSSNSNLLIYQYFALHTLACAAITPKSTAEKPDKAPLKLPIGVLAAETITTSFFPIISFFLKAIDLKKSFKVQL